MSFLRMPLFETLQSYSGATFRKDLWAGLTVGVMLIPQGMAYALIAGLPPIYGLYAGLAPLIAYAVFGSSRQLAVGPVAMVSLLVAAAVAPLADGDLSRYLALAFLLSALVGLLQLVMGFAGLGFLVTFLSRPVLSGFTSAAAVLIGFNQLGNLLGAPIPRASQVPEILAGLVVFGSSAHAVTMVVGLASLVVLGGLKRIGSKIPGALVVVVLGTLASSLGGLEGRGVEVVGEVSSGLPDLTMPRGSWTDIVELLPGALAIALIGFMSAMAVAKVYAGKNNYAIEPNQELKALGIANLLGSVFQAFPVTGGFGRSAVNASAGARTTVASLVAAGIIAVTLLFLTHLFYHLPSAVLSAVVFMAVAGLVDVSGSRALWRIDRRDFYLMLVTFLSTLILGIREGLAVGVLVSMGVLIQQGSRPATTTLGRIPGSTFFRSRERWPEAKSVPGVVVFRMDASLFYTNADYFRTQLLEAANGGGETAVVVLDAYPVNRIDSTGLAALWSAADDLADRGIRLRLAGVKGPVREVLERGGFVAHLGEDAFYPNVHLATGEGRFDPK